MAGKTQRIAWRRILYIAGIVLGFGLLAQQAWQGYLALQQAQACVARPGALLAFIASYLVAYLVQMAAWASIMHSLNAPLPPQAVFQGYPLAFLPRYIPGSIWGYLSRNEWLAQNHGIGYRTATTASLMEAAMLLVTAAGLGALYALPSIWRSPLLAPVFAIGMAAALWIVWYLAPEMATSLGAKPLQERLLRRHTLPLLFVTLLLYLIFWALQGSALVAIIHTLCGGLTLSLSAATAASALAWMTGFLIIFVPAGLGVREWTLGTLLVAFSTLQPGQATLLAVISRCGLIVAELLVLAIGLRKHLQKQIHLLSGVTGDGAPK